MTFDPEAGDELVALEDCTSQHLRELHAAVRMAPTSLSEFQQAYRLHVEAWYCFLDHVLAQMWPNGTDQGPETLVAIIPQDDDGYTAIITTEKLIQFDVSYHVEGEPLLARARVVAIFDSDPDEAGLYHRREP